MFGLRYRNYSLIILLISLLLILIIYPFFQNTTFSSFVMKLLLSFFSIAAVIATTHKWFDFLIAAALALLALASSWITLVDENLFWVTFNLAVTILLLSYVIWVNLIMIMAVKEVTKNILFGSICIYVMLRLMMSFLYILLDIYIPTSFSSTIAPIRAGQYAVDAHFFSFVYFSFVTLTTLGYGDITPTSEVAQAFAYIEAIAGQFYLTVLVARLIGLQVSNHKKI